MNFILGSNKGNYETDLYDLIISLPTEVNLYHSEHGSRAPLGIYNVATARVWKAFENFIYEYKNIVPAEKLNAAHNELLESIIAFVDDCFKIIIGLYPKSSTTKKTKYAHRWLEIVNINVADNFQHNILRYKEPYSTIVNKVKHDQARYCSIEMSTSTGKVRGYYIEGLNQIGAIIPNPEIHKMWRGMYTSISFNFDIRRCVISLFAIASFAARAIKEIIHSIYNFNVVVQSHPSSSDEKIRHILSEIDQMRELYFPDEYEADVPQMVIRRSEIEIRQHAYKRKIMNLLRYSNAGTNAVLSGDGVTTSWALPYFGGQ